MFFAFQIISINFKRMFYLIFCGGAGGGVFKNTTLFAVLPSDHCSVYKFAPFDV